MAKFGFELTPNSSLFELVTIVYSFVFSKLVNNNPSLLKSLTPKISTESFKVVS